MNLGEKLRKARLEAGLSQRQLCGDKITRNMLSLIENGTAQPSMDTLRYLSEQLGKTVGFFLEEAASPNSLCMEKARCASPREALTILEGYQSPDPVFDWEKELLTALSSMAMARQALTEHRMPYAQTLLEQVKKAGSRTPYYTPALERERLLMLYESGRTAPEILDAALPRDDREAMLRAEAALGKQEYPLSAALLDGCACRSQSWYLLRAKVHMSQKEYEQAISLLLPCEETRPVVEALEICYRELGDFRNAYVYACKQK